MASKCHKNLLPRLLLVPLYLLLVPLPMVLLLLLVLRPLFRRSSAPTPTKPTTPTTDPFNSLPEEMMLEIFSHLSPVDLVAAANVSQKWARIAKDRTLLPLERVTFPFPGNEWIDSLPDKDTVERFYSWPKSCACGGVHEEDELYTWEWNDFLKKEEMIKCCAEALRLFNLHGDSALADCAYEEDLDESLIEEFRAAKAQRVARGEAEFSQRELELIHICA
jgi:hypothetical protein